MSSEQGIIRNGTLDSNEFQQLKIEPTHSITTVTKLSSNEYSQTSKKCKESKARFPLKWSSIDCMAKLKLPMLRPDSRFIVTWKCFIFVALINSVLEIPYSMAFSIVPSAENPWMMFALMIDVCLLLDILIKFRTMYIDKFDRLRLVESPKLVAIRYIKTWFFLDLLSSFPFAFVIVAFSKDKNDEPTAEIFMILKMFRLLKLLRIVNLFKMLHIFNSAQQTYGITRVQSSIFRLFKILCLMILTAHIFACTWYSIGYYSSKNGMNSWIDVIIENGDWDRGNFVRYSYSFYWAIVTLFTTGYGDITANNVYEQWAASVGIIFGSCLFAYFIGVLTTELTEDLKAKHDKDHLEKAVAFCSFYELPTHIRRAVLTHINYYNSSNYTFDHEYIMQSLPNYVQADIERHLRKTWLKGLDVFHSLPDRVVGQIALRLKLKSCGAGKVLFYCNEIGHELYIQRYGESIMQCRREQDALRKQFGRGDVIGMDVLLTQKRPHTVVCQTYSEFYVLRVADIVEVLSHNYKPSEAQRIWINMKRTVAAPSVPRGLNIVSEEMHTVDSDEPPQHVHLRTVRNLEPVYVPRIAKDESHGTPVLADNASSSTVIQQNLDHADYEKKLLEDAEREEAEQRKGRKPKSIGHIFELFQLNRESSDLKDEQIKRHHRKRFPGSSDIYYESAATHELDVDDEGNNDAAQGYFEDCDYKNEENAETQSIASDESAGWMHRHGTGSKFMLDDDSVNHQAMEMGKLRRATDNRQMADRGNPYKAVELDTGQKNAGEATAE